MKLFDGWKKPKVDSGLNIKGKVKAKVMFVIGYSHQIEIPKK